MTRKREKEKDNITLEELCCEGSRVLRGVGIYDADYDSRELLKYIAGMNHTQYILHKNDIADEKLSGRYFELIEKRASHIPLQHIVGTANFYGYDFFVTEDVLIPRQDTECLVEKALQCIESDGNILDMCTGSGCIGITMALQKQGCRVTCADVSEKALAVAQKNAKQYNLDNVTFVKTDLFSDIQNGIKYDMIISNPPYIPTADIEMLSEEVKKHDPMIALDGKKDGLYFFRKITKAASLFLNSNGILIYEIGCEQAADVSNMLLEEGFVDIEVCKDLAGLDRIVKGRLI